MSLDGKTGSNLVNLDGKSDSNSNNITLLGGLNIAINEYPTDTCTINAIRTGGQYSNADKNFVSDNVLDTINLSSTISVSNIKSSSISTYSVIHQRYIIIK